MKTIATIKSGGTASWAIRLVTAAVVVYLMFWIPTSASNGMIDSCITALTLMAAAMSLNLLLGYTGLISIGHSAFFGIGAYTTGILVSRYGWSPFQTLAVAFVIAFVVGALVSLPALRIKGVYLALVTLALGLVFPQLVKAQKLEWLTGGARGLDKTGFRFTKDNPTYEIFGWNPWGSLRGENVKPFHYWIAMIIVIGVYLVCRGVVKSRAGRSMIAIRDNETAAAVMGVNLAITKALVFGLSAALCALPGSLSAIRTGNVTPDSTNITVQGAITFLIVMVVGGAGSLWGPIIGAGLFVFITELTGDWSDPDQIPGIIRPLFSWSNTPPGSGIFAILLIVLMFVAPFGIVGMWRRLVARFVTVTPRPAGTGTIESVVSAPAEA
ncbi:MAG: branched-chain amino acid ABC transporter permease [Actinobacteria bacterium]|nr:branched-chain amino acid ABC transporter permease [Actinomycetota bacterium]